MERAAGSAFCPDCGQLFPADAKFCSGCGAPAGRAAGTATSGGSANAVAAGAECPVCKGAVMCESRYFHRCDQFLPDTERLIRAAGVGRRVNGCLIESLLWTVVIMVPTIINSAAGTPELLVVVVPLAWLIFHLILWTRGLTPGKLILGDQVVDTRGVRAGFWRMALRETLGKSISSIVLGLGFFWILEDKDQQGWHDKIAGTLVVTEVGLS